MTSGPRVCPRRSPMPFRASRAPRLSEELDPARSEKMLGRLMPCATPKITVGTSRNHSDGINGIAESATTYRTKATFTRVVPLTARRKRPSCKEVSAVVKEALDSTNPTSSGEAPNESSSRMGR